MWLLALPSVHLHLSSSSSSSSTTPSASIETFAQPLTVFCKLYGA